MLPKNVLGPVKAEAGAGHRPGLVWWASALMLVAVGWLVTPQAVTIYDGIGQPDEPYRYVSAPPGTPVTAKPTGAQATIPVVGGLSDRGGTLGSTETGPQVSVYLPKRGLAASGKSISVTVVPVAPTTQPADGRIDGNVYQLSVSSTAGPVTFTADATNATIILRATTALAASVIEHRAGPGQQWRALTTIRYGNDRYYGTLPGAGQYAMVTPRRRPPGEAGAIGGSHQGLIVVLVVTLVLLLSVVLAVRWRGRDVPG